MGGRGGQAGSAAVKAGVLLHVHIHRAATEQVQPLVQPQPPPAQGPEAWVLAAAAAAGDGAQCSPCFTLNLAAMDRMVSSAATT